MATVLIIGAGGVGRVVAHKCAMNPDTFSDITLASRTKAKCNEIAKEIEEKGRGTIKTARVDADSVDELVTLIEKVDPAVVTELDERRVPWLGRRHRELEKLLAEVGDELRLGPARLPAPAPGLCIVTTPSS